MYDPHRCGARHWSKIDFVRCSHVGDPNSQAMQNWLCCVDICFETGSQDKMMRQVQCNAMHTQEEPTQPIGTEN